MQRLLAFIGLGAAGTFVAYSAVTLHETAYHLTSLSWQKPWAAGAAALLVVWEALALVFAGVLWSNRHRLASFGCVILLIAGVCYTFRLELVNQIQGSADNIAARVQTVKRAVTDQQQLDALQKQRVAWTARLEKETLPQREQRELRAELSRLNDNIEQIIKRQNDRPAIAEVTPEAALAARLLGGEEARWRDWLSLMLILFWPLARIIATPAAFAFWSIAMTPKPREEVQQGHLIDATPTPEPVKLTAESTPDILPKPKVGQLPASERPQKNILPFVSADAKHDVRLASLDDVVSYVTAPLQTGRHYFKDLYPEIEKLATKHFLPKPHRPKTSALIAAELGVESKRGGPGNKAYYQVKRNNRVAKVA